MTQLSKVAEALTSAQMVSFGAASSRERYQIVKSFYREEGLELPPCLTFTESRSAARLSKDDKLAIAAELIQAMQSGDAATIEAAQANYKVATTGEGSVKTSTTYSLNEALDKEGPGRVALALKDRLNLNQVEKFQEVRKWRVPAAVAVCEIPAFIKELQAIYDANKAKDSSDGEEQ